MRLRSVILIVLLAAFTAGCGKTYRMDPNISTNERPWPMSRGGSDADGSLAGSYAGRLDIIWEEGTNDKPAGPLTVAQEVLVYPSSRKRLKMYALKDGDYLGRFNIKGWPQAGLTVWQALGWYAVGPKKNELRAVDLTRDKQIWEVPLYNSLGGVLFVDDRMVVAGSTEGYLIAHHPSQGNRLWKYETEDYRFSTPPMYTGTCIVQPTDDGTLLIISPDDGSLVGTVELDGPLVASPCAADGFVYAVDMHGLVYCIDLTAREIVWKQATAGPVWTAPAVADGRLFVAPADGILRALDARTGAKLWSVEVASVIGASPIVAGDYVVFGTKTGRMYSLRASDGKVTAMRQFKGAISVGPVTNGTFIYVATDRGEIACLGSAPRPGFRAGTFSVSGSVVDAETGEAIVGAAVLLVGTGEGCSSDHRGHFTIGELASGKYSLSISAVGYRKTTLEIEVDERDVSELIVKLEPSDKLLDKVIQVNSHTIN